MKSNKFDWYIGFIMSYNLMRYVETFIQLAA